MTNNALYRLELPDHASDAEILSQVKRALREAHQSAALVISGSFAGDVTDVKAHGDMIGLLLDAAIPIIALSSGPVGQRGLAVLLAADRVVIGSETSTTGNWRTSPALAPLLRHKLGPVQAGTIVFDPSADLLTRLVECGLVVRSSDPADYVQQFATALGDGLGRRLKRALKASSELPLKEAVSFDLWFARPQHTSVP